ncbi:PH domain-containing protein [Arsenicicoccus sp. oral taxon 190]|uniref:PH domain-containing protein n=1 Tax=Arsenicicoccus sp. oral taxon 190 TaxID=1658671 RepID=UPI000679F9D1|nr:PH domain-containing protein [Arsenicicoccus sp. oral taxon 190]AKT50213.1 hypothetical protein ADJ73_00705 [Arsenicicoccus sp. oral taxon 190]
MGAASDDDLIDHGPADLARVLREPAHRVSPRAKLLWTCHGLLGGLLPVVPLAAWWWWDEERRRLSTWLVGIAVLLWLVEVVVRPRWSFAVHRWEVTDVAVVTRTGWWTQERRLAPISRVQTVDLERGPIARALRLATVTVTTASSAGAVKLEALDLAVAEELVAQLTRITAATPGDAT